MDESTIQTLERIVRDLDLTEMGLRVNRVYSTKTNKYESDTMETYDVRSLGNQRELLEAMEFIPMFFSKDFSRRGMSSYEVKHFLEGFSGYNYISNASTILAFKYLGYPMTKYDDNNERNMNVRAKRRYEHVGFDLQAFIKDLRIKAGKTYSTPVEPLEPLVSGPQTPVASE